MAEDGTVSSQDPLLNGASGPQAGLISQYVKDLSVENPNAPDSFQWPGQLAFDVQFRAESRQLNDEVHEMICTYTISAKAEQGTAYLVELAYGALVGIRAMDEEQVRRFLFSDTPRMVFPTIRLILGNVIRDAGFPPLVLEPIDFAALYEQQSQDPNFGAPMPPAEGNA